jgi:Asp-tRNA(Asn)/Glu-tRNA(Gln) amidotransferase A subunit family amidase
MQAAFTSLLELNGRLRSGEVKAREAVRETSRALKAEAAAGGAVRAVLEDEAMRAAKDVERELGRGRTRGLLQGAPFGVSELLQTSGRAPVWDGSFDARQAPDAAAVERLRRARALPLAVLASPPLGGVAEGFGAAETAGASVVARGLLPFAVSVDFNGNVLRAALEQGCCALRPTFGTVNGAGAAPLGWTLGAVSVMARTAEDCGHVLAAMSGGGTGCPHSPGRSFRFAPQYARAPQELRVMAAGAANSGRLRKSGAQILAAPTPPEFSLEILEILAAVEPAEALEEELGALEAGRRLLADVQQLSAADYLRAMRWRRSIQEWYAKAFSDADLAWIGLREGSAGRNWMEAGETDAAVRWLAAAILAGAPVLACSGADRFYLTGRPNAENQVLRFATAAAAWGQV